MKLLFLLSLILLLGSSCQVLTGSESDTDADTTEPVTRPAMSATDSTCIPPTCYPDILPPIK